MPTPSTFAMLALIATLGAVVAPSHAQVYRCGNVYTDEPCNGAKEVDLQAPVEVHKDPNQSDVFLCRKGDRQFWSAQSCQQHNSSMLSRHRTPNSWTWEQKWRHAEREWKQAERRTASQAPLTHHADTSTLAQRRRERPDCAGAEQRIRQLDDMGRQGGSVSYMERIRKERKDLRDWQFRVGC